MELQLEGKSYLHERPQGLDNDPLHKVLPKYSVKALRICALLLESYEITPSVSFLCLLRDSCCISIPAPNLIFSAFNPINYLVRLFLVEFRCIKVKSLYSRRRRCM